MMAGTTIATMNLTTSWETRAAAGEPSATIRVDNLISTISGPQDAWGRPRRPQPVSISVEVDLSRPFSASSSGDVVDTDTVHYGLLSKEIQRILRGIEGRDADLSLADVLGEVWRGLTGWELLGRGGSGEPEGFLKASSTRHLKVTIHLPKASLLGTGVSLIGSAPMPTDAAGPAVPKSRAVTLKFHHLRVPTLIGVNDNERQAAQMVVANVEVDRWVENADGYSPLEQVITKVSVFALRHVASPQGSNKAISWLDHDRVFIRDTRGSRYRAVHQDGRLSTGQVPAST